ncbi:hypothetical protein [uncultured Gimesia sp.]|uniref:hypothetical protein n=1 Tax=uncultured Gimesia sp. TaxID=1678688 RepID=UPI0026308809|nr:hypothetical protein [uncultured Gimesia sp.]
MRSLLLMAVMLMVLLSPVWGDPEQEQTLDPMFAHGSCYLGSEPNFSDLVPDADPETSFDIGHLIFAYATPYLEEGDRTPVSLDSVVPVAKVMKLVAPDKALKALVNQQLSTNHDFDFEQTELVSIEQIGYRWQVVWSIHPSLGGFTGVPSRYRALVSDRGKVIPPDLYLYDAYNLDRQESLCSNLKLTVKPKTQEVKLTQQQIEKQGRTTFQKFLSQMKVAPGKKPLRFEFMDCRSIALPMSVGADGALQTLKVWGVNFKRVGAPDEEQKDELFTVWLSEYGTVSDLKLFSRGW